MPPSEAVTRRLALYCRRAARGPHEFVERPYGTKVRRVRYVNPQLREFVWRDTEIRGLLLRDDLLDVLPRELRRDHWGDVLDLMCAMSLEAERNQSEAAK